MEKKIKKALRLKVFRDGELAFTTPIGAPEIILGFLSTFNAPENESMVLEISLTEIDFGNEKEND